MTANLTRGPLVSIITPTFNRSKLVGEAIESVLGQHYQSWEMFVCDDGSSDDTPQVLRRYNDPRIEYLRREVDRGLPCARNHGIARAKGDYIAFLDDDDKWLPSKLGRQVSILENYRQADILSANFENLDATTGQTSVSSAANRLVFSRLTTHPLDENVKLILDGFPQNLLHRNFILPSAAMMRRSTCASVGLFNEELRGAEDREYWWRCALAGAHFAHDDEVLVQRRRYADSRTAILERARIDEITSLYCCRDRAITMGRRDLVSAAEQAIGYAWENLIRFYAGEGKKRKALDAFKRRCGYGVTPRAVGLAIGSLFGPGVVRWAGNVRAALH